MNNRFLNVFTLLASSSLLIVGCGDTSSFETPGALGSNVITQIPDQDSFTLSTEKIAIEALEHNGNTSTITVHVADRHNNPPPDNTVINFLTNAGDIEPQCLTTGNACTVIWTEHLPTPTPSYKAIILAYTNGEESFTDLNDNDLYDQAEPFTDISEPFFDLNNNTLRDAATEEFVDADNDNIFDIADGLFTGTPCVGDTTVCNRVSTKVWTTTTVTLSSSAANISIISGVLPTTTDTTASLTMAVTDINGNIMADGTTVTLSSADGTATPASIPLAAGQTQFNLTYKTGATAATTETLTIEVTSSPSGLKTTNSFTTTIP